MYCIVLPYLELNNVFSGAFFFNEVLIKQRFPTLEPPLLGRFKPVLTLSTNCIIWWDWIWQTILLHGNVIMSYKTKIYAYINASTNVT